MFTSNDLLQLQKMGIAVGDAEQQITNFKNGFPFLKVKSAATLSKGILQLDESQLAAFVKRYEQLEGTLLKFTPASGAASRMFKALFEAEELLKAGTATDWSSKAMQPVKDFFAHIQNFAFYKSLKALLAKQNVNIDDLQEKNYLTVLQTLLGNDGLQYGTLPKGLLQFHSYADGVRTAMEEHLVEAALYAKDKQGRARLHFTVSTEHRALFQKLVSEVQPRYEKKLAVQYEISFSEQKKSTDTLAADEHNEPFRNADGSLLFRPGGHGALIENLNDIKADIVFIKTVDNLMPDALKYTTVRYKQALAGVLLDIQQRIFTYLQKLSNAQNVTLSLLDEIQHFYETELCYTFPLHWADDKMAYLKRILHRPIRVCGMVKNEGEPGGGPFVAYNADGACSLQIAESSQLDLNDAATMQCFNAATHFNPVDLVCSYRDAQGNYFDLRQFRDPATGFISQKSKDGKVLQAQELPGLWNGAMSDWNTVFVEVPLITFNPVKTVNDLLRREHQ
ncbi:hypothetical protein AGMMS4956_13360 [Bacteroidia bacterium]|nr:hypothetical protein AGMMS4956_13360 [Bacteroidia bacterium]